MKSVVLLLASLMVLAVPNIASAKLRVMSDAELARVRGGDSDADDGACVVNGPCGGAAQVDTDCEETIIGNAHFCDSDGATCKIVDVPGPNNITCTAGLGTGCTGDYAPPCVTRTYYYCQTIYPLINPQYTYCDCVADPAAGAGEHDTCTPYAN